METRFVSYLRVSTKRQGVDGLGIAGQRASIASYVAARGVGAILAREYAEAESGADNERGELLKALAWCKLTGSTLIVDKWDRLSRDAITLLEMRRSGVPMVVLDMPDLTNTLVASIMAGKAQHERELISQRTTAALKAARSRGVVLGGRRDGAADLREYQRQGSHAAAKVLRERLNERASVLRTLRGEGLSHAKIAAKLNDENVKTVRGKAWSALSVGRALAQLDDAMSKRAPAAA